MGVGAFFAGRCALMQPGNRLGSRATRHVPRSSRSLVTSVLNHRGQNSKLTAFAIGRRSALYPLLRSPTQTLLEGGVGLWTFQQVKPALQMCGNPIKIACKSLENTYFSPSRSAFGGSLGTFRGGWNVYCRSFQPRRRLYDFAECMNV